MLSSVIMKWTERKAFKLPRETIHIYLGTPSFSSWTVASHNSLFLHIPYIFSPQSWPWITTQVPKYWESKWNGRLMAFYGIHALFDRIGRFRQSSWCQVDGNFHDILRIRRHRELEVLPWADDQLFQRSSLPSRGPLDGPNKGPPGGYTPIYPPAEWEYILVTILYIYGKIMPEFVMFSSKMAISRGRD